MPTFDDEQLQDIFSYHKPQEGQPEKYEAVRNGALEFAKILVANCPSSADRTTAIRKLRESVMTANASIALDGKY